MPSFPTGPIPRMACSPCVLISTAATFVGVEDEPSRRAQWVRMMLTQVGLPADSPWGMAFVSHVGYRSHQYGAIGASSWPLPRTGSLTDLAAFARERKIARDRPEPGDIALTWARRDRAYVSAGIVVATSPLDLGIANGQWKMRLTTIEGNVTAHGGTGGPGIYRVTRTITRSSKVLCVRWVLLDPRRAISDPVASTAPEMGRVVVRRCA